MKFIKSIMLATVIIIADFAPITADEGDCNFITLLELQAIAQCSDQYQISREAVEGILNDEYISDDHEVKCWLGCVMTKLVIIKEGKVDWEYFKHLIKHCIDVEDERAKVDKLINKCKAEVSQKEEDVCQLAYIAAVCKMNTWKELNFP